MTKNVWALFDAKGKNFLKGYERFLDDALSPNLIIMEKFYDAFETVSDVLSNESTHVVFDHGRPEVLWIRHNDVLHNIQASFSYNQPKIHVYEYGNVFLKSDDDYIRIAKIAADIIENARRE